MSQRLKSAPPACLRTASGPPRPRGRGPSLLLAGLLVAGAHAAAVPAPAAWVDGGVPVCTAPAEQQRPVVVPTFNDGAIVVWWDARNGSYGIYAQRLDGDGSPMWGPNGVQVGEILSSSLDRPLAISDQAGGAYIVWSTTGFESPWERLIVQRIDAGGTRLWGNGVVVSNLTQSDQMHPVAVSDLRPANFFNQPGIIIAWEERLANGAVDIYAQRVDQNGVWGWGVNAARLSTSGAAFEPVICPDGTNTLTQAGGAIVAWTYHGIHSDIYANRVDVAGTVHWGANGAAICTATGDQIAPAITGPSGSRTAYISWIDGRDPDGTDIYAQRVADGVVSWAANGVPVCNAAGDQSDPVLVNAAVGAYVVWEDNRHASGDLYAQRVDPNGIAQWAANGLPLCSAPGNQFRARMIGNGAGDAFVSWVDNRDGGQDIYAQRMNANGAFIWQQNGDLVTAAANDQDEPRLAWNGTWLFATWEDLRNNSGNDNYDIYAGRLSPNGTAASVAPADVAPAKDLTVRLLTANPVGGEVRLALELAGASMLEADVFDAHGRRVRRLGGSELAAGTHTLSWDGRSDAGREEPSGIYFLRVRAGSGAEVLKLVRTR